MNWTMKLAMMAVLAGVVMVAGVVPASADDYVADTTREDYQATMWYFVPAVGKWSSELQSAIETASVKPEQACKLLPELEYRGTGMVEDLEGTTPPAEMAATHAALLNAIRAMSTAASTACTDPGQAQPMANAEIQKVNNARHTLMAWLLANVQPIQINVQPVTGN